jgi:hypothetical protein
MPFQRKVRPGSKTVGLAILYFSTSGAGFGQFKDLFHPEPQTMILVRKLPPIINVKDASFKIEASSTSRTVPNDVVETLITKTRGLLLKDRERSLRLDDSTPNYTLRCKVTGYELTHQDRVEGSGNTETKFLAVIGTIEATIEVLDNTKAALDSDNLKSHFEREYITAGGGTIGLLTGARPKSAKGRVPTPLEQRDLVVEGLAAKVAQRLVSVEEEVEIQLPISGSFKDMQEMARRKRWVELQEAADKMPPAKKDEDDSYRLYMLGLGYEGLAYDKAKTDPDAAKELLTKAFGAYTDAKEKKPREGYFIEPEIRSQESLDSYLAIEHFKKLASVAKPPVPANVPAPPGPQTPVAQQQVAPPPPPPATPNEWNNQMLIALKKQGLPDATLTNLIKSAPNPKFDISAQGILELTTNGLGSVIDAVLAKMQPAAPTPAPKPKPAPPKPAGAPAPKPQ